VRGRSVDDVLKDVQQRLTTIQFPLEFHPELIGEASVSRTGQLWVIGAGLVAIVAMFLLLQASVGSWTLAALAFVLLPASLVGGVAAILLSGGTRSLGSMLGLAAVLLIALRTSLLQIQQFQRLEFYPRGATGPDLILQGASERLPSVLTTAVVTILGLVPFLFWGDAPGLEIVQPMAAVMIGGIVTSTLLSLLVVPAIYSIAGWNSRSELWTEAEHAFARGVQHAAE